MTMAGIIIITVAITLALSGIGLMIYQARKDNSKEMPWDKIRPIVTVTIDIAMQVLEKEKLGYEQLEEYAVDLIKKEVDTSAFLTLDEQRMFSKRMIASLIGPTLKELYEKKV